jgi:hypothetical protein
MAIFENMSRVLQPIEIQSPLSDASVELLKSNRVAVGLSCMMVLSLIFLLSDKKKGALGHPYAGFRFGWEPSFLLRLRFVLGAGRIIEDGFYKV